MNELRDELWHDFQDEEYAHTYVEDFLSAEIATQIKVLREQRRFTQQQLAELTGMAQPRLSLLEDVNYGSWSIKTLKKLARAFDVTLKVSFETFGSRIGDIVNFNRGALQRAKRTEELQANGEEQLPASVVDLFNWQKTRNQPQTQTFPDVPANQTPSMPANTEVAAMVAARKTGQL
jgi:transcriptional regulator with XRE-family HTH domain